MKLGKTMTHRILRAFGLLGVILCIATLPLAAQMPDSRWLDKNLRGSLNVGVNWLGSDLNKGTIIGFSPGAYVELQLEYRIFNSIQSMKRTSMKNLSVFFWAQIGEMYAQNTEEGRSSKNRYWIPYGLGVQYRFMSGQTFSPVIYGKVGHLGSDHIRYSGTNLSGNPTLTTINGTTFGLGAGVEYVRKPVILTARIEVMYTDSDGLDGYRSGDLKDATTNISVGVGIPLWY
jgi:hypothetical protein